MQWLISKLATFVLLVGLAALVGCASVPLAPKENDAAAKRFTAPSSDSAGVYIFRNSFVGQALKKSVSIDGKAIGKTANKTYFFKTVAPGSHTLSTESEFGENAILFEAVGGKTYYARQYIKMGVLVGGSNLEMVSEEEGRKEVLECELAE